ncbi:hypothetical protein ACF0H5_014990 [Mactra antiquata]
MGGPRKKNGQQPQSSQSNKNKESKATGANNVKCQSTSSQDIPRHTNCTNVGEIFGQAMNVLQGNQMESSQFIRTQEQTQNPNHVQPNIGILQNAVLRPDARTFVPTQTNPMMTEVPTPQWALQLGNQMQHIQESLQNQTFQ